LALLYTLLDLKADLFIGGAFNTI